jgi:hypothetical protein
MDEPMIGLCFTDDDLALTLMTTWALSTGRAMPGAPLVGLTEQQLIDFWAEEGSGSKEGSLTGLRRGGPT